MKKIFEISFPGTEIVQPVLALQAGQKHCSFAIADKYSGQLRSLNYYSINGADETAIQEILSSHPELSQVFYQVRICYLSQEATLVPDAFFQHEEQTSLLKQLYGIPASNNVVSESIPALSLNNVYAIPGKLYQLLRDRFPQAKYWHQHSVALKMANGDGIRLDFQQDEFTAMVYRSGELLFAGCFFYSTPADVLYNLLKLAHSFHLSQQETLISVSGLIDRDSSLYVELTQYFLHVDFVETSWKTEYPSHYFTSLNELVQCE